MNCEKINMYPIAEYLAILGINPKYKRRNNYRYYSPLRNESTPSFDVSIDKNLWVDRGTGEGGTLIDLCMKLENISISEVVRKFNNASFSFRQLKNENSKIDDNPNYKILSKELLKDKRLCAYLESRAIKLPVANRIVKQYNYSLHGRNYFAMGIDNIKGGIELRNKYFKGTLGPKAISYFKGANERVLVFEGLMDLLSHLSYSKRANLSIILLCLTVQTMLQQPENTFYNCRKTWRYFIFWIEIKPEKNQERFCKIWAGKFLI